MSPLKKQIFFYLRLFNSFTYFPRGVNTFICCTIDEGTKLVIVLVASTKMWTILYLIKVIK